MGLIVNPISGMGGKVGLHGTDRESFRTAIGLGARPTSGERTIRALRGLVRDLELFDFYAVKGVLGGDYLEALGITYQYLTTDTVHEITSGYDTQITVSAMIEAGIDLILFSGGDGTARDIFCVIGDSSLILGIPSGVKMRSEVFGIYPESIPEIMVGLAKNFQGHQPDSAEILDVSETLDSNGSWSTELFGVAKTPRTRRLIQSGKISGQSHSEVGLRELAREIVTEMIPGKLYLIGPGRSAHLLLEERGVKGSFVGVDALVDGVVLKTDCSEVEILSLLERYEQRELILGVIGGQGFLLGRGNQQISTAVISALGFGAIKVIASAQKIGALIPATLHVDLEVSGEQMVFPRYIQVHTAPNRTILCSIEVPARHEAIMVM